MTVAAPPQLPPGPRAPRPAQAAGWALRYASFTAAARREFGPTYTVRLGTTPASVVTTDRDAIRTLLSGDPLVRHTANEVLKPLIGDRSLLQLPPREHLARRKLLLPPFHGDAVRGYADLIRELAQEEVATWRPGATVDVLDVAQRVTLEVIMRAVLGMQDAAVRAELRELIDDLFGYPVVPLRRRLPGGGQAAHVARVPVRMTAPATVAGLMSPAVMTYYPTLKRRSAWNVLTVPFFVIHDRLLALFDRQITATRTDPRLAEREDILAMLVRARDEDGRGLADEDLREELFALLSAGHETTAASIAWAVDLLAHDHAARAAATAAARDGDAKHIAAVVRETLRLHPPIPIASARILEEPLAIGPHVVPAGVPILVDAHGVHRDPDVYDDPDAFRPARFLESTPPAYGWLPFGGGAHRCVGAALAEMETAIMLTEILRRGDYAPVLPHAAPPIRRALVHIPGGGASIVVGAPA